MNAEGRGDGRIGFVCMRLGGMSHKTEQGQSELSSVGGLATILLCPF